MVILVESYNDSKRMDMGRLQGMLLLAHQPLSYSRGQARLTDDNIKVASRKCFGDYEPQFLEVERPKAILGARPCRKIIVVF